MLYGQCSWLYNQASKTLVDCSTEPDFSLRLYDEDAIQQAVGMLGAGRGRAVDLPRALVVVEALGAGDWSRLWRLHPDIQTRFVGETSTVPQVARVFQPCRSAGIVVIANERTSTACACQLQP